MPAGSFKLGTPDNQTNVGWSRLMSSVGVPLSAAKPPAPLQEASYLIMVVITMHRPLHALLLALQQAARVKRSRPSLTDAGVSLGARPVDTWASHLLAQLLDWLAALHVSLRIRTLPYSQC